MLNRLALTGQAHRISGSRVKKLKSCILWVVKSVRGGGAGAGGGTKTGHGGPGARVADMTSARWGGGEQVVVVNCCGTLTGKAEQLSKWTSPSRRPSTCLRIRFSPSLLAAIVVGRN